MSPSELAALITATINPRMDDIRGDIKDLKEVTNARLEDLGARVTRLEHEIRSASPTRPYTKPSRALTPNPPPLEPGSGLWGKLAANHVAILAMFGVAVLVLLIVLVTGRPVADFIPKD